MVKEGVLTPLTTQPKITFNLPAAVQEYIRFSRGIETADGDSLPKAKLDQTRADATLKQAKARMAELELAELEGQMYREEDVEAVTTDLVLSIRAGILALPSRLAMDLAHLDTPAECSGRVQEECFTLLNEIAQYEYDPKKYQARIRERRRMQALEEAEIKAEMAAEHKQKKRGRKPAKKGDSE